MSVHDRRLKAIWNQTRLPVVFRQEKGKPLLVRLPFSDSNREWIKADKRINPTWNAEKRYWEVPKAWFESLTRRALAKYGSVYVIQPFRPLQKCAPACWNAEGVECECSCMGEHHGSGHPAGRWYEVSETCAVSWGDKQYHYRRLDQKT